MARVETLPTLTVVAVMPVWSLKALDGDGPVPDDPGLPVRRRRGRGRRRVGGAARHRRWSLPPRPSPARPCASSTMQNPRLPLDLGTCRNWHGLGGNWPLPGQPRIEYVTLRQKLGSVSSTAGQERHDFPVGGTGRYPAGRGPGSACPRGTGPPPWWCAGTGSRPARRRRAGPGAARPQATGASEIRRSSVHEVPGHGHRHQGVVDPVHHEHGRRRRRDPVVRRGLLEQVGVVGLPGLHHPSLEEVEESRARRRPDSSGSPVVS